MNRPSRFVVLFSALAALFQTAFAAAPNFNLIGQFQTGIFDAGACEISAYDPVSQRLFVVSAAAASILVLDLSNPAAPVQLFTIVGTPYGASFNSVDVHNGIVAAAVEASPKQNPGSIVFFDTNGNFLNQVPAGALPDMITFTPDGSYVLTANEGEPANDYSVDPEGSVTIVDISGGVASATVMTASFASYNGQEAALRAQGIRIYGPGANTAKDFEPEYIAVTSNSQTAYVTLQENNALAIIDIATATVTSVKALGFIDRSLPGNSFDPSDRDLPGNLPAIDMGTWPVFSMYNPDAIASYEVAGNTFLVTANEGDVREYTALTEGVRLGSGSYVLDPTAFPNAATLKNNANLGV
jgi:DNA-binding beta-propeller fold protein YncE